MRPVSAKWFETIVRYDATMEDGQQKKVTESYVVDALTFGEAEEKIALELRQYISGDFEVKNINPAPYGEVFFSDKTNEDKWYKVKIVFITIDEKTEKEKKSKVTYLVQASSTRGAEDNVKEVMKNTMLDYYVDSVADTKILDVFEHKAEKQDA